MATASGEDPFYNLWGSPLGIYDLLGSSAFLLFAALALMERRNVARHDAWLLATPLLLIGPALGRVYNAHLPGLVINGPQVFPLFRWSVHLGGLTGVSIAVWQWSRHRRNAQPWLVVAAVILLQSLLFETVNFEFWLYNLVDTIVFSIAFGWVIYEASRRIEWHRRLMFVALLNLFGPAFSRWMLKLPLPFPWVDMSPNLLADAMLIALALHDRRKFGYIHAATISAALVLIPFHAVEPLIARSTVWSNLAPSLFGFG